MAAEWDKPIRHGRTLHCETQWQDQLRLCLTTSGGRTICYLVAQHDQILRYKTWPSGETYSYFMRFGGRTRWDATDQNVTAIWHVMQCHKTRWLDLTSPYCVVVSNIATLCGGTIWNIILWHNAAKHYITWLCGEILYHSTERHGCI